MPDPRLLSADWRLSHLYQITDKQSRRVRFAPNRAQKDFLQKKKKRNILLKSRQLGFTTLGCVCMLDAVLFRRNFHALFIAQDLDTAKDIFSNKIEYAWNNFDLRDGWDVDSESARQYRFSQAGSVSSIIVDSSGRSGTYNDVHITEFADVCRHYPEKAREIIEGTIPAVPKDGEVTIESTAQGAYGLFHDMFWEAWQRGEATRDIEYQAHFYNWTWDDEGLRIPAEDVPQEFRAYQKDHNLTDVQITYYYHRFLSLNKNWNALKREYPTTPEEAFNAITEGVIYAEELDAARIEERITRVPWISTLPVHTVWDLGKGPNMAVGFFQRPTEGKLHWIDCVEGKLGDAMPQVIATLKRKPYVYGRHFAPHDAYEGEIGTGQSRIETARDLGLHFEGTKQYPGIPRTSVTGRIDLARSLWPRLWIDKEYCAPALKVLPSYQYEFDDKAGSFKNVPLHNFASHWGDVVSYAALVEEKMTGAYTSSRVIRPHYSQNWRR